MAPAVLASAATCQPEVDGLEAGADLLHRLVAGHRAQSVDVGFGFQQLPLAVSTAAGEAVFDEEGAAQALPAGGGVGAGDAVEAARGDGNGGGETLQGGGPFCAGRRPGGGPVEFVD